MKSKFNKILVKLAVAFATVGSFSMVGFSGPVNVSFAGYEDVDISSLVNDFVNAWGKYDSYKGSYVRDYLEKHKDDKIEVNKSSYKLGELVEKRSFRLPAITFDSFLEQLNTDPTVGGTIGELMNEMFNKFTLLYTAITDAVSSGKLTKGEKDAFLAAIYIGGVPIISNVHAKTGEENLEKIGQVPPRVGFVKQYNNMVDRFFELIDIVNKYEPGIGSPTSTSDSVGEIKTLDDTRTADEFSSELGESFDGTVDVGSATKEDDAYDEIDEFYDGFDDYEDSDTYESDREEARQSFLNEIENNGIGFRAKSLDESSILSFDRNFKWARMHETIRKHFYLGVYEYLLKVSRFIEKVIGDKIVKLNFGDESDENNPFVETMTFLKTTCDDLGKSSPPIADLENALESVVDFFIIYSKYLEDEIEEVKSKISVIKKKEEDAKLKNGKNVAGLSEKRLRYQQDNRARGLVLNFIRYKVLNVLASAETKNDNRRYFVLKKGESEYSDGIFIKYIKDYKNLVKSYRRADKSKQVAVVREFVSKYKEGIIKNFKENYWKSVKIRLKKINSKYTKSKTNKQIQKKHKRKKRIQS